MGYSSLLFWIQYSTGKTTNYPLFGWSLKYIRDLCITCCCKTHIFAPPFLGAKISPSPLTHLHKCPPPPCKKRPVSRVWMYKLNFSNTGIVWKSIEVSKSGNNVASRVYLSNIPGKKEQYYENYSNMLVSRQEKYTYRIPSSIVKNEITKQNIMHSVSNTTSR